MSGFETSREKLPAPFDRARAERTFAALDADGIAIGDDQRAILESAFGNSPYLCRLALRDRAVLSKSIEHPQVSLEAACADARAAADARDESEALAALRRAKRQAALVIALADISRLWSVD